MKIDLTITYDDLSDKCKKEIEHLKSLGYDVELTYPTLSKKMPSINIVPYDATDPNNWVYCQTHDTTAGQNPDHISHTTMSNKRVLLNEVK